jgi:FkbM family methyltransferase
MNSLIDSNQINAIHHMYYARHVIRNRRGTTKQIGSPYQAIPVGEFLFYTHPNDTCVSDCLRTGWLFEKFLLSFVQQFVDPSKDVLDVGANIGNHAVVFSTYTSGRVHAFEPQPLIYDILQTNVRSNNSTNIITYPFGASNVDATFQMNADYSVPENHGAFRICDEGSLTIRCKPLDSLSLSNVGFVKMDVEGHELAALQGMKETLLSRPPLMIEIHEDCPTRQETLNLIQSYGYTSYYKMTHCDYIFLAKA